MTSCNNIKAKYKNPHAFHLQALLTLEYIGFDVNLTNTRDVEESTFVFVKQNVTVGKSTSEKSKECNAEIANNHQDVNGFTPSDEETPSKTSSSQIQPHQPCSLDTAENDGDYELPIKILMTKFFYIFSAKYIFYNISKNSYLLLADDKFFFKS